MAINSPKDEDWFILLELHHNCNRLQATRIYMSRERMAPQWRVRRNQGEGVIINPGNIPSASSSDNTPTTDKNTVPFVFNWGGVVHGQDLGYG